MHVTLARLVAPMLCAAAVASAIAVAPPTLPAQDSTASGAPAARDSSTLRVYIDHCPCRLDYVRLEVPYVDYVRDRTEADVHVLFTEQRTGSGGHSYTIEFIGRARFAGVDDTMQLATPQGATTDEVRETLVRYLKLGLVPFVDQTRAVDQLDVTYTPPANGASGATTPAHDPWNFWVFRTDVNGSGSSEQSATRVTGSGSFTADRTTNAWHVRFHVHGDYTQRHFVLSDTSTLNSYTNSYNGSAFIVKSDGPHWSVGGTASLNSSTTLNQRSAIRVAPAVEFSVFPYSQFQQRQLTVTYTLGATREDYYQITLYGKTQETLVDHTLLISYDFTQPWGTFNLSLAGNEYLQNLSKYSATAGVFGNFRVFRGFSLNLSAGASRVNNQLYLPRGQATEQDVLLELRQLQTGYLLSGRMGFSYTFGSIFNNIVNPRLGR